MKRDRTKEADLILPALKILWDWREKLDLVPTSMLSQEIRHAVVPTPYDLEPLKNRNDDRLSQVIRNLVSHRTLEKRGFADYVASTELGVKGYALTKQGIVHLNECLGEKYKVDALSAERQLPLEFKDT